MFDRALQERADRLAARVEALARALQKSGVDEDTAARLLVRAVESTPVESAPAERPRRKRLPRAA
jgi:hypothetical protein